MFYLSNFEFGHNTNDIETFAVILSQEKVVAAAKYTFYSEFHDPIEMTQMRLQFIGKNEFST